MKQNKSEKYSLNGNDFKKIVKGTGIAVAGFLLTYVAELIPNINFGEYSGIVVALSAVLINAGRKLITE